MRNAIKYLVNAVYGVTAYPGFRLFDVDIASCVTALGREGIMVASKIAEKYGYKAVYGDTDSIFIKVPFDKAEELLNKLNEEINLHFVKKYNVRNTKIRLKFEKYFKRIFFKGVKKRYAGYVIWEKGKEVDYIDVKGFELVRRDTPKFIANVQKEVFDLVLRSRVVRSKLLEYLRDKVKRFREASLEDIAIPKGISKPLDSYIAKAPHIRGALLANLYLGTNFGQGSRVKMLWVKYVEGLPKTDVICFEDEQQLANRKVEVDWNKLYQYLRSEVEDVLKLYNISWGEVIGETITKWF